ncbi:Gfo/Idh/MocA family oxidoreductase [Streptomyces sp. M10(2022)]
MFRAAGDVDTAAALLTLDDGTLATATATRCNGAGYDVRMELAGELDQIAVGLDDRTPSPRRSRRVQRRRPSRGRASWSASPRRTRPNWTRSSGSCGRAGQPCDGREALHALRIAEACEQSRRERRPVRMAEVPAG